MAKETQAVMVEGSSGGIESAYIEAFARAGWRVTTFGRTEIACVREDFFGLPVDFTNEGETQKDIDHILSTCGRLDAAIHCIGDIHNTLPSSQIPWQRCQKSFEACVGSTVHRATASFEAIAETRGSIVLISLVAARKPYPGIADYCAAKAALSSLAQIPAVDLAPYWTAPQK